jgi:hypothetical protein
VKFPEYQHQVALFQWASLQSCTIPELRLLNASLNGLRLPIGLAVKAKKMGMKRGFLDVNLPCTRKGFSGLFIELKDGKNKLSEHQEQWKKDLESENYLVKVSYKLEDSIEIIKNYLGVR